MSHPAVPQAPPARVSIRRDSVETVLGILAWGSDLLRVANPPMARQMTALADELEAEAFGHPLDQQRLAAPEIARPMGVPVECDA